MTDGDFGGGRHGNSPRRVIVNADDLGMAPPIDEAIFDALADGLATSATILANGPSVRDAVARTSSFPACSFGVHLNLTEFRPATSPSDLHPLVDQDGAFIPGRIRDVPITSSLANAVFREWAAQIEHLLSLGVRVSHIDSHSHVHTIPALFPALKRVQIRFNIRRVRLSKNLYSLDELPTTALLWKKRLWNLALRRVFSTSTTDCFTDARGYVQNVNDPRAKASTCEIMTHPGAPDSASEHIALREVLASADDHYLRFIDYSQL